MACYRPEWWPNDSYGGPISVLDIAMSVHGHITGSSDLMPDKDVEFCIRCIDWVLENWKPTILTSSRGVDNSVWFLLWHVRDEFLKN